jgi:hypothetical protein
MKAIYNLLIIWQPVITGFAFFLGILSFLIHHTVKIRRRAQNWGYSIAAIVCFFAMIVAGIAGKIWPETFGNIFGLPDQNAFQWMFQYMLNPMMATMFALLAFYIASASFRAFRARSLEATLLLLAAVIIMIGRLPIGQTIWSHFPDVQQWIQEFPNTAGQRAILIGVGLGMASTALKLMLGIERAYLGRGD